MDVMEVDCTPSVTLKVQISASNLLPLVCDGMENANFHLVWIPVRTVVCRLESHTLEA